MGNAKPPEPFNVQAIADKIDRGVALGDEDGAVREINRPWPGMDGGIGLAVHEWMSGLAQNGTVPLFMKDLRFDDAAETVSIQFPDGFQAANRAFERRYPNPKEAGLRFQKAMSVLRRRLMAVRDRPQLRLEHLADALKEWLPADWPAQHGARLH